MAVWRLMLPNSGYCFLKTRFPRGMQRASSSPAAVLPWRPHKNISTQKNRGYPRLLTKYYYRYIYDHMAPTSLEAYHYTNSPRFDKTFHTCDRIQGTESFNTTRQVPLYTTSEHHERTVYLQVYNTKDHARIFLESGDNPPPMPKPLHSTVNDEPIDMTSKGPYEALEIREGQVFRIWFGEEQWDERDQKLGSAEVAWTPQ